MRRIRFLAQTKGRRERERERKRIGKEDERKGEREREIGSEALAETEKSQTCSNMKTTILAKKRTIVVMHYVISSDIEESAVSDFAAMHRCACVKSRQSRSLAVPQLNQAP